MTSEYSWFLTESAEADLDGFVRYFVLQRTPEHAVTLLDAVDKLGAVLREHPGLGHPVKNPLLAADNVKKAGIQRLYVVYFQVVAQERAVYGLRVVPAGVDQDRIESEIVDDLGI